MFMVASRSRVGRAHDSLDDARMRPAATEVVGERVLDLRLRRFPVLGEQRGRFHDHAVDTVAALRRLLLDEGALHRVQPLRRAQALERDHLLRGGDGRERRDTRAHRIAVDVHRAGTALREPTAEARTVQREVVAQSVKQRHIGVIDGDGDRPAVHVERFAHGGILRRFLDRFQATRATIAVPYRRPRRAAHCDVTSICATRQPHAPFRTTRHARRPARPPVHGPGESALQRGGARARHRHPLQRR